MSEFHGEWPIDLSGITESIVTTPGPNGRWNVAALGLHDSRKQTMVDIDEVNSRRVCATTWGRTRTWRNFTERGEGYVQFTDDPVAFVEAACTIREEDSPVIESAAAWVRVEVTRLDSGTRGSTQWVAWELQPLESDIEHTTVPSIDRGFNAVVEATVAASRLDVPAYDESVLTTRLSHLAEIVETCGGEREREAFTLLSERMDLER